MRILATLGGVIVLAAVAAFGGSLVAQQIEMTAKQNRALNADIDRIVAERHDKNRAFTEVARAGLPALASASGSERVEEQVRKVAANPMPSAEVEEAVRRETASLVAPAPNAKDKDEPPQRPQRVAKRKQPARLFGPVERVVPLAFASLPKFTAHTLLGLR